jgi:squalene cyclase
VRVSSGAWFYVRCAVKKGSDEHDAFIAHTYSSVRTLVARANGADTVLYLGSPQEDGEMVLRRVVAVRQVRNTNMHIFEFEDAQAVLWDEKKDVEAASVYVDIDAPVCIG